MALDNTQLATLKADIAIQVAPESGTSIEGLDPTNADQAFAIAQWYNQLSDPAFIVWRTNVPTSDVRDVIVWAEYDTLSVSKQNAFSFLVSNGTVNAAKTNVRQGIASIFGSPQQSGNLAALIAIAKRTATKAEKLLATGEGSSGTPGTMTFEGQLAYQDVLNSNNV